MPGFVITEVAFVTFSDLFLGATGIRHKRLRDYLWCRGMSCWGFLTRTARLLGAGDDVSNVDLAYW